MLSTEDRKDYNLRIIKKIEEYIEKNPQMRFIQALWALGIITRDGDLNIEDRFYEEPDETFKNVIKELNYAKNTTSKKIKESFKEKFARRVANFFKR